MTREVSLTARVREIIDRLRLEPRPEGGFYRETWRSPVEIAADALPEGYSGPRAAMTSILFLLPSGMASAFHRVRSEELWMHHQGDDLTLYAGSTRQKALSPSGRTHLGQAGDKALQAVVPAGYWQGAEALEGPAGYALVGCVVAPGFDFDDFEVLRAD